MQRYIASFSSISETKTLCANSALPCEAKSHSEVILASLETKKKAFKAKPGFSNPRGLSFSLPESPCWIYWASKHRLKGVFEQQAETPLRRNRSHLVIPMPTNGVSTYDSSLYPMLFGVNPHDFFCN